MSGVDSIKIEINNTKEAEQLIKLIKPISAKNVRIEKKGNFYFSKINNINRGVYMLVMASNYEEINFYREKLRKKYKKISISENENLKIWNNFSSSLISNFGISKIREIGGIYILLLSFGLNDKYLLSIIASFRNNNFHLPKLIELEILKVKFKKATTFKAPSKI